MHSYSQLGQDHWVLKHVNKTDGTFIDIGAHDGVELSNTYLLEQMGWTGLCVEPNRKSYDKLRNNRNCLLDNRAVCSESGLTVKFSENIDPTLSGFSPYGLQEVTTVSLNDLLNEYNVQSVDYINLDVEGAELEILQAFNFNKYKVKCWTIEHNLYSNGNWQNFWNIMQILLGHNYLVKTHDWDFFAVLDDTEPEFYMNYRSIDKKKI